jgi:heat-inducible transcriptional repressor|tara:strand:- start:1258 stop:2277 length:1020 start_codon:yes stop_codon:yes gene_type:complete
MNLDIRAQTLLRALIKQHIKDGHPVASKSLACSSGLDLSSASIRGVMKDLEDAGFILSPHRSSGRVPTQMGYRFFVDSLLTMESPNEKELSKLKKQIILSDNKHLSSSVSEALSELTKFAGVVMIPKAKKLTFKHIEFLNLSDKRVLVIIVTDDGNVQNRILFTDQHYEQGILLEASNYFNQKFEGHSIEETKIKISNELKNMKKEMINLMTAAIETSSDEIKNDNIVISGQGNLLGSGELSQNVASIKKIIEVFEKKTALLNLLDKSYQADGMQIFIGQESGYQALDECSVITAPYHADGEVLGTIGVIGPTRMAYERIIPIVNITAKLLSNSIQTIK